MRLIFLIVLFFSIYQSLLSQITNSQVNYELRIDQWRQTCDNDALSADDNEVKVGLTSDTNTGGTATWTSGGNGATCGGNNYVRRWQADAPSTVTNSNTLMYYCTNRTNNANNFTINYNSWEEDGAPDCSSAGDACAASGSFLYTFKSATLTPSIFWGYSGAFGGSYVTGTSGDFFAKSVWRYTNGGDCATPLTFGTLVSGVSKTHVNSNRTTPAGASSNMGYTNVLGNAASDVYYSFTISVPSNVTISTNNAGTNYDTYLRLYNSTTCGTQIAFNDDFGGSTTSFINIDLCAGTYVILVEGYSSNVGDFNLSVLATDDPVVAESISGISNGTTICSGNDPGDFNTSTASTGGVGAYTYQWESSTTSAAAGFSAIPSTNSATYNPGALSQTTWFRRRTTDECSQTVTSNVINVIVNSLSTALTAFDPYPASVCPDTDMTLTVSGGTAGTSSSINWYTGPNGTGSFLGSGSSLVIAPSQTTTYYVRREGACNTTTDLSTTVTVHSFVYAANGTSSSTYCTDNSGWHHFYTGGNIILSVQGDFSGVSSAVATINVNGSSYQNPSAITNCASNVPPGDELFEMARSWNLDVTGTTSGSYNVRFYHPTSEKSTVETAAINWTAANPACGYTSTYPTPNGFYYFKNTGSSYSAPDFDGTHLTSNNGSTINGLSYAALSGITSFSGGSGAVSLSPIATLAATLNSFTAHCEANQNSAVIRWTTASEMNSSQFILEKSFDGVDWNNLATLNAAGNSEEFLKYEVVDIELRGFSQLYYRLKEVDLNGDVKQVGLATLECTKVNSGFELFPNPTRSNVNVVMFGLKEEQKVDIRVLDLKGQVILYAKNANATGNLLNLDLAEIAPGCYLVQMVDGSEIFESLRLIKE